MFTRALTLTVCLVIFCGSTTAQATIFVNAAAPPGGDGLSWAKAFDNLHDALDAAQIGEEIWIAQGIYTPTRRDDPGDPRSATFRIDERVTIRGGFRGDETALDDRPSVGAVETFLTGNRETVKTPGEMIRRSVYHVVTVDHPHTTVPTLLDRVVIHRGEADGKAAHGVGGGVYCVGSALTITDAVLQDNFAFRGGSVYGSLGSDISIRDCHVRRNTAVVGGGVLVDTAELSIVRSHFEDNAADVHTHSIAGAIGVYGSADLLVSHSTFSGNVSELDGPAIYIQSRSLTDAPTVFTLVTVTECTFRDNHALQLGRAGAIAAILFTPTGQDLQAYDQVEMSVRDCDFFDNSAAFGPLTVAVLDDDATNWHFVVDRCRFVNNKSSLRGGGLYLQGDGGEFDVSNCEFIGNIAGGIDGGGFVWADQSDLTSETPPSLNASLCSFLGNQAPRGAGFATNGSNFLLTSSAFEANRDMNGRVAADTQVSVFAWTLAGPHIRFNCIPGFLDDTFGNIGDSPHFRDPIGPDNIPFSGDENLRLRADSPCINAGDPSFPFFTGPQLDLDLNDRFQICRVDIGAYETALGRVDCNANGLPDACDVFFGVLPDCDDDGVPDPCEPLIDCNNNGIQDACDPDCNNNGVPDECDLLEHPSSFDCNGNALIDACEVGGGLTLDCDNNQIPDECDLADGTLFDCNNNGLADPCDLIFDITTDCDDNSIPDECDLAAGTLTDCNANGVADACETIPGLDCDNSGVPDDCELAAGVLSDCNGNGRPDVCDIADGESDCDLNGIPDICDIDDPAKDCNGNGIVDVCDVVTGTSDDCNFNIIPDECDILDPAMDCNANGIPDYCDAHDRRTVSGLFEPFFFDGEPSLQIVLNNLVEQRGDVLIEARARADLGAQAENIIVRLNNTIAGSLFNGPAHQDCLDPPDADTLTITAAQFNSVGAGSTATISLQPTGAVGDECIESFLAVDITYTSRNLDADMNANDIPDDCECPADCAPSGEAGLAGNGVVDIDDLMMLIDAFGPANPDHSCDIAPLGGDGIINLDDLLALVNAFGPCP